MTTRSTRTLVLVAAAAWLVVAAYGARHALVDEGDGWELPYMIFSLALAAGAATTVTLVAEVTKPSARGWLRMTGLLICGLGVLSSIVAWALPLWMVLLGVGLTVVTVATAAESRRSVALLAASQAVGLAVLYAALVAEVGRQDSYGGYPAAGGIALVVTGVLTIVALSLAAPRRTVAAPRP